MLPIKICGDDTLSIDIADPIERASIARHLRDSGAWLECVEGMRCVALQFDAALVEQDAATALLSAQLSSVPRYKQAAAPIIQIPVCYGGAFGPEFESICELLDLAAEEFIDAHASREHRVDLIGFTPGFAYVSGLRDDIVVPRLTEPRQRVAAGSVGIAAGLTGVYALAGPGGWPLIGRTPMPLFEPGEAQPFVFRTGMRVNFTAIDEQTYRCMAAK